MIIRKLSPSDARSVVAAGGVLFALISKSVRAATTTTSPDVKSTLRFDRAYFCVFSVLLKERVSVFVKIVFLQTRTDAKALRADFL